MMVFHSDRSHGKEPSPISGWRSPARSGLEGIIIIGALVIVKRDEGELKGLGVNVETGAICKAGECYVVF